LPSLRPSSSGTTPPPSGDVNELHAFVLELGRSLSLAGTAVSETQERLTAVAAASGAPDARIVVLPTALMIAFGRAGWATIESIPQLAGALRLDQVSALYELVEEAERGTVEPADGLCRLKAIREMRPRHGPLVTVIGYAAMTIGLCLVLKPTPSDLAFSAGFGVIVGAIVVATKGRHALTVLVPVVSAMVVSALCFEAVKRGWADPGLRALIAPLVTFLPGAALTTATVELASGEMVAGASRLVFGSVQLLLLAFGIVAGVEIAGLPSESVLVDNHSDLLGAWAPWLGVLVFGVAASVYFSAPRGALPWLLLVLFSAWVGQVLGDRLVGGAVSGFFGALVMAPIALAVARLPSAPPPQVTYLPAFWLLVPGALGLIGLTEVVGNPAAAGLEDLVTPVGSLVSIALGVLAGVTLYRGLETARAGRSSTA
jgi:uncharacterized membrane protein YjjP (DUF1212 family)